ncbi:peptidase family M50-domain-containing protein [Cokeromyces recurvatus]|uniref:peptidase family M50-domain-containing protein n=1 Tax=Cokeromyces recurvatus TaxID=90255 RepID=UPI0022210C29|nr:peptidase family M50-domain-containing protein [Cokeromyces recurvatus]KAI7897683.1 peptidase family M50-domain-containing protein [Cokeromyces recurvatus]
MKSVLKFTCQYVIVWLIFHVVIYFIQKKNASRKHLFNVKPFNISWRTSFFNSYFIHITHSYAPHLWRTWFQIGTIITFCIMFVGIWIVTQSSVEIFKTILTYIPTVKAQLIKRNFILMEQQERHGILLPIIPGLTLPLDHIHYFLLALMMAALFHELGHCLCAGVYGLTIKYFGLFLHYLYPGAFISISQADLDTAGSWQKIQIACAGIWHNLILYTVCIAFRRASEFIWSHLGWKNLVNEDNESGGGGVSVVSVHATSPLYTHLLPGMRIIQLDDTPLKNSSSDWKAFWNMNYTLPLKQGFCTLSHFMIEDKSCCDITSDLPFGNFSDPNISCFQNIAAQDKEDVEGKCLDTMQILTSIETSRCTIDDDCSGNNTCVVPFTPSIHGQRVRLFGELESKEYTTIIYEGTLEDVLNSVQVSHLHPKYNYLPPQLPHQIDLLTSFIATLSLSLALLNSVPAFKLDGMSILCQLLRKKRNLFTVITRLMSGLVLFIVFGSVFIFILQKM